MAHDDRDRIFEKALTRHLRSSSPSGFGSDATSSPACPDPEILAAYHEQSLSPSELTLWKAHVVACTHCQFVLAQLAATDKIALEAAPRQDALLASELAPTNKRRSLASPSIERERRPPSWRWVLLIPAGAMAAVLFAWIAIRTPKPGTVPESPATKVAENRQPAPLPEQASPALTKPAAPLAASPKAFVVAPSERKTKDQPAGQVVGGLAGAVPQASDSVVEVLPKQVQSSQQSQLQSPASLDHGPSLSAQKQLQQQLQQRSRASASSARAAVHNEKKSNAQAATQPSLQPEVAAAPPVSPPPPPPSQDAFIAADSIKTLPPASGAGVGKPASAPASSQNSNAAKVAPADSGAITSSSEAVEVTAAPESSGANRISGRAMLRAAAIENPRVFWAPGGKHAWRLGAAGLIEHSNDHGEKWTPQLSGVTADLVAASAPSAKLCWIVGKSGTILLTTDGGAHWQQLVSPVPNDLSGVRATDASHAIIYHLDPQNARMVAYQTSDGGATWSPVPGK